MANHSPCCAQVYGNKLMFGIFSRKLGGTLIARYAWPCAAGTVHAPPPAGDRLAWAAARRVYGKRLLVYRFNRNADSAELARSATDSKQQRHEHARERTARRKKRELSALASPSCRGSPSRKQPPIRSGAARSGGGPSARPCRRRTQPECRRRRPKRRRRTGRSSAYSKSLPLAFAFGLY